MARAFSWLRDFAFPNFNVDDLVRANNNLVHIPAEGTMRESGLTDPAGQVIRLEIRGRGAKSFAVQYTEQRDVSAWSRRAKCLQPKR